MSKIAEVTVPDELRKRVAALTDDELFVELRIVVNNARFSPSYDRAMARAVSEEFHKRGFRSSTNPKDRKP